jgi:hypothetical protein
MLILISVMLILFLYDDLRTRGQTRRQKSKRTLLFDLKKVETEFRWNFDHPPDISSIC